VSYNGLPAMVELVSRISLSDVVIVAVLAGFLIGMIVTILLATILTALGWDRGL
jgi:hypothetical protein